jgi:hypothetical protein
MKKIVHFTLVFLAGISVALSCSKVGAVDAIDGENAAPAGKQIIIHATLADAPTRVEYTLDENGEKPKLTLKWETTDALLVSNASGSVEIGNPTIDATGKTATFSGTLPEGGEPYTVVVQHAGANLGATQTQTADGDLKHLEYAAMAEGVTEADFDNLALTQTTGVLGLIAKLPTVVSAAVKAVIFQTESNLFNGSNTLTVNLTQGGAGDDNILYVYANVAAASIPAGTEMFIRFKVGDGENDYYTRYQVFASAVSLATGALNGLKLNCSHIDRYAGKDDKGTAAAPYLIADGHQLAAANGQAAGGSTTFFKLIDDVDMTGISHNHINTNSGYTQVVDFDGNEKTISHLSNDLFYVLKGSVYDLTLDQSIITRRGILAEYIQGSGNEVRNITVSNGSVNYNGNNAGGLIGTINSGVTGQTTATISDCIVSGTDVTGVGVVGGVIGFADAQVEISGCEYTGGTVTSTARYAGGFVGSTGNYDSSIENCKVEKSTIDASVSNNDFRTGGFVGLLQTKVIIKGCSVGAESEKVSLVLSAPASGKVYNVGGFVGVCYGTITQNGTERSKAFTTVSSANPVAEANANYQLNLGGFVGYHTGKIEYADAGVTMDSACGKYVGGFCGYLLQSGSIQNSSVSGTVSGNLGTGGFVGLAEKGSITECTSDAVVSRTGSWGSSFGAFAGIAQEGIITKCSTTSDISISANYVGGFIGGIETKASTSLVISKCCSTGNVSSGSAQCGGFIGHIACADATANVTVEDCYETGNVLLSNQRRGGLVGQINSGNVRLIRCYASGNVNGSFALGGLVGFMNATATIEDCAAWNGSITAGSVGNGNWSSGSIVGVTWPIATLTNNFRKPTLAIKAYWGNVTGFTKELVADYDHPDVSSSTPLIVVDKTDGSTLRATTASSAASGQDNYPLFAYHGKVEVGKTLSQLASTTLGWSGEVWDFTGDLPVLK